MAKERKTDWDAIEPHYRAGIRSLKDIGVEFEVSDAGIIKHARQHGWTRNLKAKIQAKADAKVSAAMVSEEVSKEAKLTESTRVEVESEVQARIRLSHRTDIQRGKRITNALMQELEAQAGANKKLPLKERAAILKQLTDTQRVQVALEREAFGIAQMVTEDPTDSQAVDPVEGARRMAFVLNRAAHLLAAKGQTNG
jgi:hypothetical protein